MPTGHNQALDYTHERNQPTSMRRVCFEVDVYAWEKIRLIAQAKGVHVGVILEPFIAKAVTQLIKENPEIFANLPRKRAPKRKPRALE